MAGFDSFDKVEAENAEDRKKEEVAAVLWQKVVTSVVDVLSAHHQLGFTTFQSKTDPSIEEMELSLASIDGALSGMVAHGVLTRQAWNDLTNCLQSIHLMRRIFVSLKLDNVDEYNDCIQKLSTQKL